MSDRRERLSRREFLGGLTLAGTASLLATRAADAEPPPETTRLRLIRVGAICVAPEYVAEDLLKTEGFTDVQYVKVESIAAKVKTLAAGDADITLFFVAPLIVEIDAGQPLVGLAGVHVGCLEVFATERIRAIHDLKGGTVAVSATGSTEQLFLSSMLAYVGVDPRRDVRWLIHPPAKTIQLLADGKIDGYLALPPVAQELRARKIGHVIVNSSVDRPWSQYFCCLAVGHREFVKRNPVATKRALRALLKAADLCAREPERVARLIADRGYLDRVDYALQTMKDVPYDRWRTHDPADAIRFYALRLQEVGMIKSTPPKILGQGTDWRFLNELKKELKG